MAFEFNQIAAGHNNQNGLERWSKLVDATGCKLFQSYKRFIPTEWNPQEGQELGGDRLYVKIGLPWFSYNFAMMSEEELSYVKDTYTTNGISGHVTVTVYDRDAMEWKDFNATLHVLPENVEYNLETGFYDARLEFRDLEEI